MANNGMPAQQGFQQPMVQPQPQPQSHQPQIQYGQPIPYQQGFQQQMHSQSYHNSYGNAI